MKKSMTVMEVMNADTGLFEKAKVLHERFGCPGKNFPCIKLYASGKCICEGCWMNFFQTQVPVERRFYRTEESKDEAT